MLSTSTLVEDLSYVKAIVGISVTTVSLHLLVAYITVGAWIFRFSNCLSLYALDKDRCQAYKRHYTSYNHDILDLQASVSI